MAMGVSTIHPTVPGSCPEIQADVRLDRLAGLPAEIRDDLKLITHNDMGDGGGPLLNTDAPTARDMKHPNTRFFQAMSRKGRWYVQFEVALSGVRTLSYAVGEAGRFYRVPSQYFGGPPCESLQAAMSGVLSLDSVKYR